MEITLNLNFIRYINLLERVSKVRAKASFLYNNTIFFIVSKKNLSKAIGKNGRNMKIISSTLKKKIKVLKEPSMDKKERVDFIREIINPIKVEDIKIKEKTLEIKAGLEERSMLIGRNRKKEEELISILKPFFEIEKIEFIK